MEQALETAIRVAQIRSGIFSKPAAAHGRPIRDGRRLGSARRSAAALRRRVPAWTPAGIWDKLAEPSLLQCSPAGGWDRVRGTTALLDDRTAAKDQGDVMAFLRAAHIDSGVPASLHEQVTNALRAGLQPGVRRPGAAIPAERELAEALGRSRVTGRRAIKTLVHDRVLVQRPGARTIVAHRVEKPVSVFVGFSQDMQARGLRPGTVWLDRHLGPAVPDEALALALSPGASVVRLRRLRTADDVPMALESSVVPARFLPDPSLVIDSLYTALAEQGVVPVRALQRIRAIAATPGDAGQLGVPTGTPLFDMERRCFSAAGQPVEFCRSLYRSDLYDLLVELAR